MTTLNGILKNSKIRGGRAVVRGTSIEVSRIMAYINSNYPEKVILQRFPQLNQECLDNARRYYAENKEEIDAEIYLIEHPEKEIKQMGYKIIEEKSGVKRVIKK